MKFTHLFCAAVILLTGVVFSLFASDESIRYVEVKKVHNVYVKLDPKSDIIRQVRKGEYVELLREGLSGSWYEVKIDGKIGYLEGKAGRVVSRKGASIITHLIYVILLIGCAAGAFYYVRKQQTTLSK